MLRVGRPTWLAALLSVLAFGPAAAQRYGAPPPHPIEPPKLGTPRIETRVDTKINTNPNVKLDTSGTTGLGHGVATNTSPVAAPSVSDSGESSGTDGVPDTGSSMDNNVAPADDPAVIDAAIDQYLSDAGGDFIDSLPIVGKMRHVD